MQYIPISIIVCGSDKPDINYVIVHGLVLFLSINCDKNYFYFHSVNI